MLAGMPFRDINVPFSFLVLYKMEYGISSLILLSLELPVLSVNKTPNCFSNEQEWTKKKKVLITNKEHKLLQSHSDVIN